VPAAIKVEGLWKEYVIGAGAERATTFYDLVSNAISAPFKRFRSGVEHAAEENRFWALKDVSFEVQPGEVVGVIGRNGAGKSTLLKILSRITAPTKGRVEVRGRLASLLEVGTGFHPELSGRENIYLNGAILGMTRRDIAQKFDEIVAFAEVEKFIDTPVKRYSSGMYVRLAFAVAAHLESDVLIVDEVLAVGDQDFQAKCLGRMKSVATAGRTVFLVSHNMDAIRRLATRVLLMSSGELLAYQKTLEVIDRYLSTGSGMSGGIVELGDSRSSDVRVERIELRDASGRMLHSCGTWDCVVFRVIIQSTTPLPGVSVAIQISTLEGVTVALFATQPDQTFKVDLVAGVNAYDCTVDRLSLAAGTYRIGAGVAIPNKQWLCDQLSSATIHVAPRDVYASGLAPSNRRFRQLLGQMPFPIKANHVNEPVNQFAEKASACDAGCHAVSFEARNSHELGWPL
jgi:lipopolysaccharide transport system ATP-binding protein